MLYCSKCSDYFGIDHSCTKTNLSCAFCKGAMKNVDLTAHKCFRSHFNSKLCKKNNVGVLNIKKRKYRERNPKQKNKDQIKRKFNDNEENKRKRMYRCADCEIKFESRNSYRQHKYQVHNEDKYKVCTLCGKSIVSLSQHLKGVHGNPTGFRCSQCDKTFSCKKHLQRHMLVHSDRFNHICTTCGKGFKTSFSMRVHMRSHEDVKPFDCPMCSKTFTTKQWRNNHMKTHG